VGITDRDTVLVRGVNVHSSMPLGNEVITPGGFDDCVWFRYLDRT
jgi:hypothetical protein